MFGYRDFRGDDRLLSIYKGIIYTDIKAGFCWLIFINFIQKKEKE